MKSLDVHGQEGTPRPLSSFEERLNKRLGREKKPLRIDLHFAFSYHGTAADLDPVKEEIDKADVILLEFVGWNKKDEEAFQAVADGKREAPERSGSDPNFAALLRHVHGTQKAVGFIDTPQGHDLETEGDRMINQHLNIERVLSAHRVPLNTALELYDKTVDEFVKLTIKREALIVENFEKNLSRVIKPRPIFRTKSSARVTIPFGAAHTALEHALHNVHPSTTRSFPSNPHVFDYGLEYKRRKQFKVPISEELALRALFEHLVGESLRPLFAPPGKDVPSIVSSQMRQIIDSFSVDDIQEYYKLRFVEANTRAAQALLHARVQHSLPVTST